MKKMINKEQLETRFSKEIIKKAIDYFESKKRHATMFDLEIKCEELCRV